MIVTAEVENLQGILNDMEKLGKSMPKRLAPTMAFVGKTMQRRIAVTGQRMFKESKGEEGILKHLTLRRSTSKTGATVYTGFFQKVK